jgi:predicted metal-dependent hydrolase
MKSEIIEINGVGRVLFERSRRAKHINISVRPFKGVRVAVPLGVSFKKARAFALSKSDWVRRHQAKMRQVEQDRQALSDNFPGIKRREARKVLVERMDELAQKHGFQYNRVFIRNQKTRWGSCSVKNNINLNVNLVRLPDELIDYILLHELVHTRVKTHGRKFWDELNKLVGDAKGLDRQLNRYKVLLI